MLEAEAKFAANKEVISVTSCDGDHTVMPGHNNSDAMANIMVALINIVD